jgi:ABC-type nitrate/sulfonate/bicarbonate transport system substrate-binding protein
MKAWFDAVEYRLKNPEETREIAAKYMGVSVDKVEPDNNLKIMTYTDNLTLFNPGNESANSINHIANSTADYLIAVGALIERPDLKSMFDPQYFIAP